jgi:hypothetical protein
MSILRFGEVCITLPNLSTLEMQPGEISPISSGRDSPASPQITADLQHMSPFIVDFPFSDHYLSDVQSLQICP